MALIDVVAIDQPFVGSRAVWNMKEVKEIVCSRAEADYIGLSSIGGSVCPVGPEDDCGLYLLLGDGHIEARATVLPGTIEEVGIQKFRKIALGEEIELSCKPCVISMDGEREIRVKESDEVKVQLARDGPKAVDISQTIKIAARRVFLQKRITNKGNGG